MDETISTEFQAPEYLQRPTSPTRPATRLLICSLLAHCALVVAIALFHSAPQPPPVKSEPIRARLVFVPPAPQPAPQKTEPEASKAVNQPVTPPAATINTDETPAATQHTENVSEPVPTEVPANKPAAAPPADSQAATRPRLSSLDAARAVINQQYQQALQQDAAQAGDTRRRLQTQPVLNDSREGIAGMNARQTKPVIVNCDSNINQVLTLLSGITGGTLQCSERSDFEAFVDKRVTKLPSDR
ncbi:hypothetical protein OCL06_01905 [Alteromonas sp. ASW11-19]|uniref:Energy transducer TonB n=1 Tax=Alteromonas salexigens TaxID=2982530 RepID=A0ABT2VJF3_9ALTE|nr:hypothetical protein [Alteromonas salexigens]MCU7553347.1 hypothetical protein [Alteromonas salexigens]